MSRADFRLCAVLEGEVSALEGAGSMARGLRGAGCTTLIYRAPPSFRVAAAELEAILFALQGAGATVLVAERVDLALASGAAGVLLGQADIEPRSARSLLGSDAVIALAIADSAQADELFRLPVDAAFLGPVESRSGEADDQLGHVQRLAFRAHLAAPGIAVVAGPGLATNPAAQLIEAGADGIALAAGAILQAGGRPARAKRTEIDLALATRGQG